MKTTNTNARENLEALELRLSMMVWDVTARAPSREEITACRELRAVVGEKFDAVNNCWVELEEGDTDTDLWR